MNLLLLFSLLALDYRPAFLDAPALSRATALGSAYAGGDDAAAVFLNPAGISRNGLQFALSDWLVGTRLAAGAGTFALGGIGSFGAGVKYLSHGTLSRWNEDGNYLGDFSAYSMQGRLGYGRRVLGQLAVGVGAGLLAERVDSTSVGALTGDLGLRYTWRFLTAGLALRDFAGTLTPFSKTLGIAAAPWRGLLVTAELEHTERLRIRAGIEYAWAKLALRGGFDGSRPCGGFGVKIGQATLDYALVVHRELGLVHQISVGVLQP
jgi:hypothetical protein